MQVGKSFLHKKQKNTNHKIKDKFTYLRLRVSVHQ